MIDPRFEPRGLRPDETSIETKEPEHWRRHAVRGSTRLRDAILTARGIAPPTRTRKPRLIRAVVHQPTSCPRCGAPERRTQGMLIADVQAVVAAYYELHVEVMVSARRDWDAAHPRQVAMYLCSQLTAKSTTEIGKRFGGRDHTTVIHAIRAVKQRILNDPEIAIDVAALTERLAA